MSSQFNSDSLFSILFTRYMDEQVRMVILKLKQLIQSDHGDDLNIKISFDNLHDLRVACRRILSVAMECSDYLPACYKAKFTEPFRIILKNTTRLRDYDVLLNTLNDTDDKFTTSLTDDVLVQIITRTQKKRSESWNRFLCFYNSNNSHHRYEKVLTEIEKRLEILNDKHYFSEMGTRIKNYRISDCVASILFKSSSAITVHDGLVNNFSDGRICLKTSAKENDISVKELHKLRLAFKRFHYLIELFSLVYPLHSDDLLETVKAMQDVLGSWHDKSFALNNVIEWCKKTGYKSGFSDLSERITTSELNKVIQVWQGSHAARLQDLVLSWLSSYSQKYQK